MNTFKTIISDFDKWIDIAVYWYKATTINALEQFGHGYDAAIRANDILTSAPSDVGGSIYIGIKQTDIDELFRRYWLMKFYCDSVHYEIDKLIDDPFVLELKKVIDVAYDLDPKDFKATKSFFDFAGKETTLQSIVSSTFNDFLPKIIFDNKARELNNDEPSQNFKDTIHEAIFWQKEYIKADMISNIAQDFIENHNADWYNKSPNERLSLLTEYCVEIGKIFDGKKDYESSRGEVVGVNVKWISESDNSSNTTADGLTYGGRLDGVVYINDKFGTSKNNHFNLQKELNTVTHETRHQYQAFSLFDPDRYNTPKDIIDDWFDYTKRYWLQPIEVDSRAFAGLVL